MTDNPALQALLATVEAGEWLTVEMVEVALPQWGWPIMESYEGSLDAARALHDAVLPGWYWFGGHLNGDCDGCCFDIAKSPYPDCPSFRGFSADPARAWLIAILRALIAGGGRNDR